MHYDVAMSIQRRRFLACLPAVIAPAGAGAFRLEAPSAEVAAEYGPGCPAGPHQALTLGSSLPWDAPPEPLRCRFCGCPIAGALDHGEAADRPADPVTPDRRAG